MIKVLCNLPQMVWLQRAKNQDFMPELSESGYEFRAETLLEQHLHILLKAPFGQMPDVLKYLRADVRGRHDKEPAQIIGFVIAERDSRSIELLKQDSENRGM